MEIIINNAPEVKHIKIDIDFTGDGPSTTVTETKTEDKLETIRDVSLNLTEDFTPTNEEVVEKPEIDLTEREVKVAQDMQDMEI